MAENQEHRYQGIMENIKNTHARGSKSFRVRTPSPKVADKLREHGIVIEDAPCVPGRSTISFEPTLEMFNEVQDTP